MTSLLALALAAQDAHARLAASADGLPEEGRFLIAEVEKKLGMLVARVRDHDAGLDSLREAISDRMNNLLMAIKTASDLLRGEEGETAAAVRERLDATVESGRQSVKRLRDAVDDAL